jgi:hypothetical protein
MRDLGRRLVIALGIVVAAAAAVGYAWIAGGIAQPLGVGLGSVERPSDDGAHPFRLEDGRPAWIVSRGEDVLVLDARAPTSPGELGRLVAWCGEADGVFVDILGDATFGPDGQPVGDADRGLLVYPTADRDGGAMLDIGRDATVAPVASDAPATAGCPPGRARTIHRPAANEIFDPTVAGDEEPRGWVWLEGRLTLRDGEPFLCDGLDGSCTTGAAVGGIDPALIPGGEAELAGVFIGRVDDGAIVDLSVVPDLGGSS